MKTVKRMVCMMLSLVFILSVAINDYSFAEEGGGNLPPKEEQVEKYMGLLRYVSYSKNKNPNVLYGYLSEQEERIEVGKQVSFNSLFPANSLKGKITDYELLSVEPYTPNFHFGASIYDDTIFDNQYPTDYFPVYPHYLKDKTSYQINYVNYSVSNLTISNPKLTEKGITANMSCILGYNGIPYVEKVKASQNVDRYIDNHLYRLVGGKSNADAIYTSALERLRGKSIEQLNNENGYIWFVPYVITVKKKSPVDLILYDGKFEHKNNQLCYEYKVKLANRDKVEQVPVRDNNKTGVVIPLLEKDKPVTIRECVPYPNEKPVKIDIFVNPNKDTPTGEKTYDNNSYQGEDGLDLSVVSIDVQKKYPPNSEISVPVQIKSTSPNKVLTDVTLSYKNKKKPIQLLGNDYVTFDVTTPDSGCMTLTAEINKDRSIKEKDYTNNKKSVQICVEKPKEEKPISGCPSTVTWQEVDSRWETETYESCHTDSNGKEKCKTKTRRVKIYYTFTYQAELKSTLTLKDDKGKQINKVMTKAGYGIIANVDSKVTWKQLSGAWNRTPKQKPTPATKAVLTTDWKVKKIHNQPKNITLKGNNGMFTTPVNSSSKNSKAVIYTDVDLPDGTHGVTVYVSGAKAGGKEMCNTLKGNIKIKGDMYEDYKVN